MKSRAVVLALLAVAVAFAGCADKGGDPDPGTDPVITDPGQLQAGKGAISGLLIDDRFRPLAGGSILLQEAGTTVTTNENGEFQFVNLEPGKYTIRATLEGHEAAPSRVTVVAGEFTEANIEARRSISESGVILSYEYAAFSSCGVNAVAIGTPADCTGDLSGDTDRAAFTVDYRDLNITHIVMEMRGASPEYFDVWMRPNGQQNVGQAYQILGGPDTQYLRFQLDLNETSTHDIGASGEGGEGVVWDNKAAVQTVLYLNSLGFEEGAGFGVGAYLGVQANFLQSAFLGEPEVDVDTFCVYCG